MEVIKISSTVEIFGHLFPLSRTKWILFPCAKLQFQLWSHLYEVNLNVLNNKIVEKMDWTSVAEKHVKMENKEDVSFWVIPEIMDLAVEIWVREFPDK